MVFVKLWDEDEVKHSGATTVRASVYKTAGKFLCVQLLHNCEISLCVLHVLYKMLKRSTVRSTLEVPVVDEKVMTLFFWYVLYMYMGGKRA